MAGSKPSGSKKGSKASNGGYKAATPEPPAANGSLQPSLSKPKLNKQLAMIDAQPDAAAADTNGRRSRRAAATAAEAAIAHTAAFEHSTHDSMSPPIVEEQAAFLRIYEQAALENAYLASVTVTNGTKPSPAAVKRKAIGFPGSPTAEENTNKKIRSGSVEPAAAEPALGAQQARAFPAANSDETSPAAGASGERSRRATKPSVRLNEIDHLPKKRQTRPYVENYSSIAHRTVPSLAAAAAAAHRSTAAAGSFLASPGGTKPSFGRNADRPETLEDAGADIPSLIEMAAACADVLQVEQGIDQRLPAYKGNNIHARLLRLAFSALRLGAFTMRKPSVALMAKKLWLLAGRYGQEAAQAAAATVGQEHLPLHLHPFGASDPTPVGGLIGIDPVLEEYFEDIYLPGASGIGKPGTMPSGSSYGTLPSGGGGSSIGGGARGPYRTGNFVPPVVDLSAYNEDFVKLASLGRAMLQMRRGQPAKLQQLLKTSLLAGKKILYKAKSSGRLVQTGEITEKGSIRCYCSACKGAVEVTPTDFEIHAGSSDRRPADSIYLEEYPEHSLRDLLNVMMSDAAADADVHMDHCMACKLGGDLLCCDGCTSAYHLECASLTDVPTGQWYCPACIADFQRKAMFNSRAGGTSISRGRGRGRGKRGRPPADGGRGGTRGRGRGSRAGGGGFDGVSFGLGGFAGSGAGGRVHMMAPSAMRRNANRPTRNLNRNKRLFEVGEGGLQHGEALRYMNRGSVVLSGTAVLNPSGQSGILCECCSKVLSCSQFESHAGHSQRRQPYECIFTDDGRNLKAIAAALPTPEMDETADLGIDDNDEGTGVEPGPGAGGCVLCYDPEFQRDFGPRTMMLCDQCEREFHVGCMSAAGMATLDGLPEGDWFCSTGCGKIHGILRKHVSAGQIPVVFSSEDGQPRSQLPGSSGSLSQQQQKSGVIVPQHGLPSAEKVVAAAESAAIAAMQAAAAALAAADMAEDENMDGVEDAGNAVAELAYADAAAEAGPPPAGMDIAALAASAGNAAASGAAAAGIPSANNPFLPSLPSTSSFGATLHNAGYTWQVLNGKDGRAGTTHAIKAAAEILQESFDPIIEQTTNTDLLPLMLYAQQYGDWDYRGVYTLLLRYKGKPVVAATSRVFGPQYAELPLIATRSTARRQGHARVLVSLFLNLLSEAGVHKLVLPAAHETVETWKNGFNFIDMPEEEVAMAKQQLRILVFPGTEVLWKVVENTVPAEGHHILRPIPPPEDILGVRHALHDLVTAVAVASGEEAPKDVLPAPPAPEVAGEVKIVQKMPSMAAVDGPAVEGYAVAAMENGGSYERLMEQAMVAGAAVVDNGGKKAAVEAAGLESLETMNIDTDAGANQTS